MITKLVNILRPVCVAATIALTVLLIICVWGWELMEWDTFWRLFYSYLVLMLASTVICYIDNPKRITGR